jgi:hypothetical protein
MNGGSDSLGRVESSRHVLFLDFDGVLHRLGAIRTRKGIASTSPSIQLFEFAPILVDCLVPYISVEIVLSTSWVHRLGYQRARSALPAALRERVIGSTFHSKYFDAETWASKPRGAQVLRYIRRHRLTKWLAIDDEILGFAEHMSHVVRCDESLGLGDLVTQKLLRAGLAEQFENRVCCEK